MGGMAKATSTDRKATVAELRAHADVVRRVAMETGVSDLRLRDDGALVVYSPKPGYGQVITLSRRLTEFVGAYVHVISNDAPAAASASAL